MPASTVLVDEDDAAAAREQRGALLQPHTQPFLGLADESICLLCASPLSTNCGFSNYALAQNSQTGTWQLEMQSCTCEQCDLHANESANDADLQDGMARQRMLDRHRFSRLDAILRVDAPLETVRLLTVNRVPVLQLRSLLADYGADLGFSAADLELFETHLLRSFEHTTQFIYTEDGQALFETRVVARVAELETMYQICVPQFVIDNAPLCRYYSAALLRVVSAYDHIRRLVEDLRWRYDTDARVQTVVLYLQLFADTHLDLMVTCDGLGGGEAFGDRWLTTPTSKTIIVNLEPLPANASAQQHRERRDIQNKALMSDAVYFSPLERAYPHPLRCVYAGEMINFGPSLLQSNIWVSVREVTPSETSRTLHAFLGKAAPHKCMKRNLDTMMSQEIGSQPGLVPVICNMLETTQLGNYPGARTRPLWRSRLCTRRSYHWERFDLHTWCAACHSGVRSACPHCEAEQSVDPSATASSTTSVDGKKTTSQHANHLCEMCQFLRHNKFLVFFAIKEFFVFSVRQQGLLNTMLEQESGWIEHCSLLLHAVDDARRILSAAFADRNNANPDVVRRALWRASRHMVLLHDCNKPTMKRLFKSPFLYPQMLSTINRHHRKEIVVWNWTGCQEPADFLIAPLRRDSGDPDAFPTSIGGASAQERFYGCDERLPHLNGQRWCDVYTIEQVDQVAGYCARRLGGDIVPSMLKVVGMSPEATDKLELLCFNSVIRDMPDNRLAAECRKIGQRYKTDYHLLHCFLRALRRHHVVRTFPLDAHQTRLQARVLRLRHRLDPWSPLPRDTHCVAVCRNDADIFATIVNAADGSEEQDALSKDGSAIALDPAIFARGVTSTYFDHKLGGLVCSRDYKSANSRKWRKQNMQRSLWYECDSTDKSVLKEARSAALSIRTSNENKRACESSPLEYHSLLGVVLCVKNRAITLCVKCGAPCIYQDACMSSHGITCGREIRFAEADRHSQLRQFSTLQTHALRTRDDNGQFPIRDSILFARQSKNNAHADLFDRITTPVFDQSRGYDRLMFINAMAAQPRRLLNNGDKLIKHDVTYLLDPPPPNPEEAETPKVLRSRASRPRTSRKQKQAATDDIPQTEELGDDDEDCGTTAELPVDDKEVPMKFAERQSRAAVAYAERHRVKPHNYSDEEWAQKQDDEKLFAWMKEGRAFREQYIELRDRHAQTVMRPLAELMTKEYERVEALRKDEFFEKEMQRMRAIDECIESEARTKRTLCVDNFTERQISSMSTFFMQSGMLEIRHDIVCAFCRIVCDPRGQYKRVTVDNMDAMLVHPLTNKPLEERGAVEIWLCNNEFGHAEHFLRARELPLATDLFFHIKHRRQRAQEQALKKKSGAR